MKKLSLFLFGAFCLAAVSVSAATQSDTYSQNSNQVPCNPAPCYVDTVCAPAPCYTDTVCAPVNCAPAPCNVDTVCAPAPCAPAPCNVGC